MSDKTRIYSLNVRGLNNSIKRKRTYSNLYKLRPQILFLQETHLKNDCYPIFNVNYFKQQYQSPGSSKSRGVAILIAKDVRFNSQETLSDKEGRYIFVKGQLEDTPVTLASIYMPNQNQEVYLRQTLQSLNAFKSGQVIVGGDLSLIANRELDKTHKKPLKNKILKSNQTELIKILTEFDLVDIWRFQHPKEKDFTFFSERHKIYSRIDFILVSTNTVDKVSESSIGYKIWSDHAWVNCSIITSNTKRQPPDWILDNFLLENTEIFKEIELHIQNYFKENYTDNVSPLMTWDAFKPVIRGILISKASYLKKIKKEKRSKLVSTITKLEQQHKKTGSKKIYKKLLQTRRQLEEIDSEQIRKKLLYLKQKIWTQSSKNLKILAHRVNQKKLQNMISSLKDEKGNLYTDSEKIMSIFYSFYSKLYSTKNPQLEKINQFLKNIKIPKLIEAHKKYMESPFTSEEILTTIKLLKTNKSPGPDGFISEFYKYYAHLLVDPLVRTCNTIMDTGKIPPSWKNASIIVIPKPNADPLLPKSYRPISLLNTDLKIFTATMARRLNTFITNYISQDQAGFMPQRDLIDNTHRIFGILNFCKTTQVPAFALSIDIEKAFDSLEIPFLKSTLQTMGFGQKFLNTINALYKEPLVQIKLNNRKSEPFFLSRGTRQGCPLSPLLFAIGIEPLAIAIRESKDIPGIVINKNRYKITLFADDILITSSSPLKALEYLQRVLKEFGEVSGLVMNKAKTTLYPINIPDKLQRQIKEQFKFKWISLTLSYLGIQIPLNLEDTLKYNHLKLQDTIENDMKRWNKLTLSWNDRLHLVRSFILPKFIFIFRTIPIKTPTKLIKKWQNLLLNFFWNNKQHRINQKTLYRETSKGGLRFPNLMHYYDAIQLSKIVTILQDYNIPDWVTIINDIIFPSNIKNILWQKSLNKIQKIKSLNYLIPILEKWNCINNKLVPPISRYSSFIDQKWFPPGINNITYKLWQKKGVYKLIDLTENLQLIDKQKLEQKLEFKIPWFSYVQLKHFMSTIKLSEIIKEPLTDFEQIIKLSGSNRKHLISLLYKTLNNLNNEDILLYQKNWHKDINISMDNNTWNNIWNSSSFISKILPIRQQSFKLTAYWYMTPTKLAMMKKNVSKKCWKNCKEDGTYLHCWYSCPKIKQFWKKVLFRINKMFDINLCLNSKIVLLNMLDTAKVSIVYKEAISILLSAARTAIAYKWKNVMAPNLKLWHRYIWSYYQTAKLTKELQSCTSKHLKDNFAGIWFPIMGYLAQQEEYANVV